jgi:hypothetical protein
MPTGCIVAGQYGILVPTIFVIDLTSRIVLSLIEAAGAGQAQGGSATRLRWRPCSDQGSHRIMPLVVTSTSGVNGNGYRALLAFEIDGSPLGVYGDDARISDPRGLAFNDLKGLLFVNSGAERVLALDMRGRVVRDTGPIAGLNPGGGNFAPDGRRVIVG